MEQKRISLNEISKTQLEEDKTIFADMIYICRTHICWLWGFGPLFAFVSGIAMNYSSAPQKWIIFSVLVLCFVFQIREYYLLEKYLQSYNAIVRLIQEKQNPSGAVVTCVMVGNSMWVRFDDDTCALK